MIFITNILSYPEGSIFTGKQILEFIAYHINNKTGKTNIAKYMKRKFSNVKPDKQYKLFRHWSREYDEWSFDVIDKPILLRVDHTSPIVTRWNCYEKKYYSFNLEGTKSV